MKNLEFWKWGQNKQYVVVKNNKQSAVPNSKTQHDIDKNSALYVFGVTGALYLCSLSPLKALGVTFAFALASYVIGKRKTKLSSGINPLNKDEGKILRRVGKGLLGLSFVGTMYLGHQHDMNRDHYVPFNVRNVFFDEVTEKGTPEVFVFCRYKALSVNEWKMQDHRKFVTYKAEPVTKGENVDDTHIILNKTVTFQKADGTVVTDKSSYIQNVMPHIIKKLFESTVPQGSVRSKFIVTFDKYK